MRSIGSVAGPLILRTLGASWRLGGGGGLVVGRGGLGERRRDGVSGLGGRQLRLLGGGTVEALLVEHLVQVVGELSHQLGADVAHDPPTELGDLAGDVQVGGDDHPGARGRQALGLGGDLGGGVAPPTGVAADALDRGGVVGIVAVEEVGLALELAGDRAEFHLHDAAIDLTFDLLELGSGEAGRDALDVGEDRPGLVDRSIDGELVDQLFCHRRRSSAVSISAGEPEHATSRTRSGRMRISARAPSSPLSGSRCQTERSSADRVASSAGVGRDGDRAGGVGDGAPGVGCDERLVGEADHDAVGAEARRRRRVAARTDVIWPSAHRSLATTVAPATCSPICQAGGDHEPVTMTIGPIRASPM